MRVMLDSRLPLAAEIVPLTCRFGAASFVVSMPAALRATGARAVCATYA
jgi:hypothetical protein